MNNHEKRYIFAFVGPSQAGKTTLIRLLAQAFPDELEEALSFTTRKQRDAGDSKTYRFVTPAKIRDRSNAGKLIQLVEYAGNLYANDRDSMDRLLRRRHALIALTEDGVRNFRAAGYDLIVIRVIPFNHQPTADTDRLHADVERARQSVDAQIEVLNSFAIGGLERTAEELKRIVKRYLQRNRV